MSSTFAQIVKAQRIDQKQPGRRRFDARNIYTLAHRARTGQLTAHKKNQTALFKLRRFWYRIVRAFYGDL